MNSCLVEMIHKHVVMGLNFSYILRMTIVFTLCVASLYNLANFVVILQTTAPAKSTTRILTIYKERFNEQTRPTTTTLNITHTPQTETNTVQFRDAVVHTVNITQSSEVSVAMDSLLSNKVVVVKLDHIQSTVFHTMNGRLANNLFQFASIMGIARSNDAIPCFDTNPLMQFFDGVDSVCVSKQRGLYLGEDHHYAKYVDFRIKMDTILTGYLQSYKYFEPNLQDYLKIKPAFKNQARAILSTLGIGVRVGIHVRKDHPDYLRLPGREYYEHAIRYIVDRYPDAIFLIISDDIEWCKSKPYYSNIRGVHFQSKNVEPIVDIAILSECDHVILSRGTFGWWGAFLGAHMRGGIVIYNRFEHDMEMPVNNGHFNAADYYPQNWIPVTDGLTPATDTLTVAMDPHVYKKHSPELRTSVDKNSTTIKVQQILPINFIENENVIVTGASHNHFNALHLFLRDWPLVTRDKKRLLVIYDLGLSENQLKTLNISYPFPVVWRTFKFLKFPRFFNISEARGEYAWKAVIVTEVHEECMCSVLWLDSGVKLSSNSVHQLELRMRKSGFVSSRTSGTIKDWVYPDSLNFLVTDTNIRMSLQVSVVRVLCSCIMFIV